MGKYKFNKIKDKNDLIGCVIVCKVKEEETDNIGFLLRKPNGVGVIISAKEIFLSEDVKQID